MPMQINPHQCTSGALDTGSPDKEIVWRMDQVGPMVRFLQASPILIFDFETSGLAYFRDAAACGIALAGVDQEGQRRSYYVPFRHATIFRQLPIEVVSQGVAPLLADPNKLKIAHHIKFDEHMARREGWRVEGKRYDTMIAAHIADENKPIGLKSRAMSDLHRNDADYWEGRVDAEVRQLAKKEGLGIAAYREKYGYSQVPLPIVGPYACLDVELTHELYKLYEKNGLSSFYGPIFSTESKLTGILCEMEEEGLPIDVPYVQKLRENLVAVQAQLLDSIFRIIPGKRFNLASDQELRDFLTCDLRLPLHKLTEKEQLAVDAEVLEEFSAAHPAISFILQWREAEKIRNTYTTSILSRLDRNNILHPDYQQVGTVTGRLACKSPNFQNQVRDDDDRAKKHSGKGLKEGGVDPWSVRRAYVNRGPGWVRLFFDYCLHPSTLVETVAGKRALGDLKPRDRVFTCRNMEISSGEVSRAVRIGKLPAYKINFDNGESVIASVDHEWPVAIIKGQQFYQIKRKTENLQEGQWVLSAKLTEKGCIYDDRVSSIEYVGLQEMFAITVEPDHNYILGCGVVTCNSQIELRVLAHYSQDPTLVEAYLTGEDIHSRTSMEVFGNKSSRQLAKILNFGLCIAGGQKVLTRQDGLVPIEQVQDRHFLWDGVDWVRHAGLVCRGEKGVVTYEDLTATPEHLVFLKGGRSIPIGCLASSISSGRLALGAVGEDPVKYFAAYGPHWYAIENSGCESCMSCSPCLKTAVVYDLLDAGPRNRFTVEGKIVSNSYCMSAIGYSRNAKIPQEEAEKHMAQFFARYSGIKPFREKLWAEVQSQRGYFQNIFGRPRRVIGILSPGRQAVSRARRQIISTLIQGTAAELTKESLCRIHDFLRAENIPAKIVATVHDEIQIDCPVGSLSRVARETKRLMEDFSQFAPIPILVDGQYSTQSWSDKQSLPL
jgi:DNA polymerase I-like protein with 3'-5' exonuclease and polymerase domains